MVVFWVVDHGSEVKFAKFTMKNWKCWSSILNICKFLLKLLSDRFSSSKQKQYIPARQHGKFRGLHVGILNQLKITLHPLYIQRNNYTRLMSRRLLFWIIAEVRKWGLFGNCSSNSININRSLRLWPYVLPFLYSGRNINSNSAIYALAVICRNLEPS